MYAGCKLMNNTSLAMRAACCMVSLRVLTINPKAAADSGSLYMSHKHFQCRAINAAVCNPASRTTPWLCCSGFTWVAMSILTTILKIQFFLTQKELIVFCIRHSQITKLQRLHHSCGYANVYAFPALPVANFLVVVTGGTL